MFFNRTKHHKTPQEKIYIWPTIVIEFWHGSLDWDGANPEYELCETQEFHNYDIQPEIGYYLKRGFTVLAFNQEKTKFAPILDTVSIPTWAHSVRVIG